MMKFKKKLREPVKSQAEKSSIYEPNEVNKTVEIPVYVPNQGLMPKEYQVSAKLNYLESNFKEICMEFLSKSNPDEYNSSYMDAIIERVCIDAIRYIELQRSDHETTIVKLLDGMHRGDYRKCVSKLEFFKRDKEENEDKLCKYRKIYYHGTSLEE